MNTMHPLTGALGGTGLVLAAVAVILWTVTHSPSPRRRKDRLLSAVAVLATLVTVSVPVLWIAAIWNEAAYLSGAS